ncbi:MAG: hypothetical protein J5I92_13390, partial [Thiogranum sp.]|nr:hypothetical protein [Thiogranum sp.]
AAPRDAAPASPPQHRAQAPAARSTAVHRPDRSNRYGARPGEVRLAVRYGALVLVALVVSAMRTGFESDAGDGDAVFAVYPETSRSTVAQSPTKENAGATEIDTGRQAQARPVIDIPEHVAANRKDSREPQASAVAQIPAAAELHPAPQPPAMHRQATESARDVTPGSTALPAPAQQPEPLSENSQVALADNVDPLPQTITPPVADAALTDEPVSRPAEVEFASEEVAETTAPEPVAEQEPQANGEDSATPSAADLRQQKIDDLLARGHQALREERLLIPADNNAYNYFREVLGMDPDNTAARDGIERIVRRYALFAKRALDRHDEAKTRQYIERGLRVRADDRQLLSLQHNLDTWLARLEEEARQIPELPPPPPLPTTASQGQPNDFIARLKAFFTQGRNTGQDDTGQDARHAVSVEDRGQPVPR